MLAVFMGGLALGSLLGGRIGDRLKRPLVAYAAAEAGIGLYALAIPRLLAHYPALNAAMVGAVGERFGLLSLGRAGATALLLLVPTTLMGATLPLLGRAVMQRQRDLGLLGRRVGALYAANTTGAVVGTFSAGFLLLPGLGVYRSNLAAALADLALAAIIVIADRRMHRVGEPAAVLAENEPVASEPASQRQRSAALVAFGASGAVAMVYQVLWSRALAVVLGSSVYSFTLILLAFLIGLAGGAWLLARAVRRIARPVTTLALLHLGVAAAGIASYLLIDELPGAFLAILRGGTFSVDGILFSQFLLAALTVLPATSLMGGVLPLTLRIYARGSERVAGEVGRAYAINTLGAIVGSFAAGFVVLPRLGLQHGLALGIGVSAAIAVMLLWLGELPAGRRRAASIAVAATVAVALALLPSWNLGHFQAGLFRVSLAKEIVESGKWLTPELLYYRDGISTSVSVERWGKHLAMKNNGKVDASNGDDMPTQIMVGLLPLLFHPTALERRPRVAVVGYGSGVTVGAATQFPIGQIDVVELEPEILAAARWFDDVNHRPAENPRVRIVVGDGRNFLGQGGAPYDVIISEPSNPWITGVSNLFTRDYWIAARERLADDGLFCQWGQLYELSPTNIKTILRTFGEVFPYTYVFSAEDLSSDVVLIATRHPLQLDRRRLQRNFAHGLLAAELARAGVHGAEDVLAYLLLTPDELPAYTAGADINTDDQPRIEFAAPRDLLGYMRFDPYLARVYGADWPYGHFDDDLAGLGEGRERAEAEARIAESLIAHGKRPAAARFIARALPGGGAVAQRTARLADLLGLKQPSDPEVPLASEVDPLDPPRVPTGLSPSQTADFARDYAVVESEMGRRRWAHALAAIRGWPERYLDEGGPDLQLTIGYLLYKTELEDDAIDRLRPLAADESYVRRRPAALYYLGRALYAKAVYDAGVREMRRYLDLVPAAPPGT